MWISVVVRADVKVHYTDDEHIMHCLCPLIPNMVAMYSLVYYFDQSSIKF